MTNLVVCVSFNLLSVLVNQLCNNSDDTFKKYYKISTNRWKHESTQNKDEITQSVILTLGIRGRLHTAGSLAERVREVDVSFSHDSLVQGRKLSDHLWHGLLQQVLLFALLHILFTETWHAVQHTVSGGQVGSRQLYVVCTE